MLEGKVIIVTGAATGIGRASALHFAANGARVVVADWNAELGSGTAEAIRAAGSEAIFVKTDVASEPDVEALIGITIDTFGQLDGAFNNAGVEMHNKLIADLDIAEWQRVIDVDLTGVFLCMKHEMRAMKARGGAIVNTASANGLIAQPASSEYIAAKHGVVGITRAGSTEFEATGVRVNAILPGLILTPMIEDRLMGDPVFGKHLDMMKGRHSVGRFGQPEDIAKAAKWLLSDECPFVNGLMMSVDGGYVAR